MSLRRAKVRLLIAGIAALTAVCCMLAVGAAFCSATLHVQRRAGPKPPDADAVQIAAKDKAQLRAWWFKSATFKGGCVVVLHGIGDSKVGSAGFAPMFVPRGYSVLAPDSRGHGESGGALVTYGLLEKYDVIAWAHWMQNHGCRSIYGLGESLGASILIQAAAVEPVFNAVAAECPFADLREMAEYRIRPMVGLAPAYSKLAARGIVQAGILYARIFEELDFRQVDPLHSISLSGTPMLLIHGVEDDHTPAAQSEQLAARRPRNTILWLVPHGGHTNASVVAASEFRQRVLGWFSQH